MKAETSRVIAPCLLALVLMPDATDPTLAQGTFALYAWGCAGAKFRNVKWLPAE